MGVDGQGFGYVALFEAGEVFGGRFLEDAVEFVELRFV